MNPRSEPRLADTLNTAIVVLDERNRPIYLNSAAEQFLGTSYSAALKSGFDTVFAANPLLAETIREALVSQQVMTLREIELVLAHESTRVADCAITPRPDYPRARVMLEFNDIERHLRISRDARINSLQMTTRQMMRGLAHELKNPLGGLRGAAQLLERELPDDRLTEYTRIILQETDRLRGLIDRMLGPIDRPDCHWVNVHEPLEQVRQLLRIEAGDKPLDWQLDYDPSIPDVWADRDQLVQVLLNLARNAVQAMREGNTPEPRLTFRTRVMRQFTIHGKRHRLAVRIDVEDNGPGVPEDLVETLFLPMVSGRAGGSGLGLSLAQTIAERHQGMIEFVPKRGLTRFSLILPIHPDGDHAPGRKTSLSPTE
ncbi:nitrogen regulation protein NR(II) [Guyparkeria sp. TX1]|uniref:nitrogen regulation protein NR(II) n=1 Tax=Guyparkeria sp. TX1 TaxID=3115001 RepID=UPI003977970E